MKILRFFSSRLLLLLSVAIGLSIVAQDSKAQMLTIESDAETEFSVDGKAWSPAVPTWVHPAWPTLQGATWIWTSYRVSKQEAVAGSPVITFRRKFILHAGVAAQGTLQITADNAFQASLNGTVIGSNGALDASSNEDQQWHSFGNYALKVQPGDNQLIVKAINYHSPSGDSATSETNPAGVVFSLVVSQAPTKATTVHHEEAGANSRAVW